MPDHSVIVGVYRQRAMPCKDNDGDGVAPVRLYSRGQGPDRPVVYETDEFRPHCEVSIETISKALVEFLETGK